jgi:predicted MFS family arabinose efflux permease
MLLVTYKFGDAFATGMLRPFLADAGLPLREIGKLLGTVGFVAGLLGALAGGALVNRLGRRRALLGFGALQALTVAGYAWLARGHAGRPLLYALCAAEPCAGGMATAALFTCMMDWCAPATSATDYTVQASAVVVATGIAASVSGFSAQALGYFHHFIVATGLAGVALLAVARLFPHTGNVSIPMPEREGGALWT